MKVGNICLIPSKIYEKESNIPICLGSYSALISNGNHVNKTENRNTIKIEIYGFFINFININKLY